MISRHFYQDYEWELDSQILPGTYTGGPILHISQQELPLILLKRRPRSPLFGSCFSPSLEKGPVIRIPSNTH